MAGMDRFQWWISFCCWLGCFGGHFQHSSLHCNQPLGMGFPGHGFLQEKSCHWCCPGDDHWTCLHHSRCRSALCLGNFLRSHHAFYTR
ncbi:hypothetical protein NC652_014367 [Populus alba x Populus x berolinensis]|nr:hypothetical protein NC652_014367 [Populus alba x Populus x berolinensis]